MQQFVQMPKLYTLFDVQNAIVEHQQPSKRRLGSHIVIYTGGLYRLERHQAMVVEIK
jgi:hypothetical protein